MRICRALFYRACGTGIVFDTKGWVWAFPLFSESISCLLGVKTKPPLSGGGLVVCLDV